jgi:hypothetical protein
MMNKTFANQIRHQKPRQIKINITSPPSKTLRTINAKNQNALK